MAEKKNKKSTDKGNEIYENPEVLAEKITKTEEVIEKNPMVFLGIFVAIAVVFGGYFGYKYLQDQKNEEANSLMFQAVYYFEADSLQLAMHGDGNSLGFSQILSDYSGTDASNLANFYMGASFLKQGQFKEAMLYLEDFSSSDILVQARSYSLLGDCYMELNDYDNAIAYYTKAADYKSNKFFSPSYLLKAGLAYELNNDKDGAIKCYDKIIKDFYDAQEVAEAKKKKARLTGSAS